MATPRVLAKTVFYPRSMRFSFLLKIHSFSKGVELFGVESVLIFERGVRWVHYVAFLAYSALPWSPDPHHVCRFDTLMRPFVLHLHSRCAIPLAKRCVPWLTSPVVPHICAEVSNICHRVGWPSTSGTIDSLFQPWYAAVDFRNNCRQSSCGDDGMVSPLSYGPTPLFSRVGRNNGQVLLAFVHACVPRDQVYYFALVCSTCCYGSRAVRLAVLYSPRARKAMPPLVSVGLYSDRKNTKREREKRVTRTECLIIRTATVLTFPCDKLVFAVAKGSGIQQCVGFTRHLRTKLPRMCLHSL